MEVWGEVEEGYETQSTKGHLGESWRHRRTRGLITGDREYVHRRLGDVGSATPRRPHGLMSALQHHPEEYRPVSSLSKRSNLKNTVFKKDNYVLPLCG